MNEAEASRRAFRDTVRDVVASSRVADTQAITTTLHEFVSQCVEQSLRDETRAQDEAANAGNDAASYTAPEDRHPSFAALRHAEVRTTDMVSLPVYLELLVAAADDFLAAPTHADNLSKRKRLGLAERAKRGIVAFAEEDDAADAEAAAAAASSDDEAELERKRAAADAADVEALEQERTLMRPGAECAVEAIAALRLCAVPMLPDTVMRLLLCSFVEALWVAAARASYSARHGSEAVARHTRRLYSPQALRATRDDALFAMACAGGCDTDELAAWCAAFTDALPERLRERAVRVLDDGEDGVTPASSRRGSFVDTAASQQQSGRSSVAAEQVDSDDDAPANKDDAGDDLLAVSFFFVLAELKMMDAGWAAWVPRRSGASHAKQRTRRRSSLRRKSSVASLARRASSASGAES